MSSSNRNQQIGPPKFSIAVHILVWLAKSGSLLSSASIACQVNSHATFLRRVLALLSQADLVEAREGRDGGYSLKRPASEITLGDVYMAVRTEMLESADASVECGNKGSEKLDRTLEAIMAEAERVTVETLKNYTIAQLMNDL
ncbi:RrF2 family transcriptional regulator [Paenibacillus koleovorans]|uniref:RrF2 family transcriptional regulator n=1 Tax=Paenibacillus koleovorans TaxID=121608 RepID=UPI000FDA4F67|nr:Rrf2 family transcriptional regulator [Paenibacillus koleovorans]